MQTYVSRNGNGHSLPGQARRETFFDLYERSVQETQELIEAYFQTQDFSTFTKQIPF